ncbi:MAG TPA: dihydrolipoyl dehydrogenase [Candidatus Polarisedimenticolia bacterium]|nr:dihydrolipoyl dehydrogenase [Candidatus Polarisedimenticolia bacterium]
MAEPQRSFDLTIIGSGPGGYVAAIRAAQVGLKTLLVEKSPALGGTCLHIGCIPTKSLLHSAEILESARDAGRFGVKTGEVRLDLAGAHKFKADVVRRLARGIDYLMKKNEVTVLHGHGRLKGAGRVEVATGPGDPQIVTTRNVILATGSVPKLLPGLKVDGTRVITSNEALGLEFVPKTLIILGAGAVGVEFASIYSRFGSGVTLVEMLPRVLPLEDEEVSAEMLKAFRKRDVAVRVATKVEGVKVVDRGVEVQVRSDKGGAETLKAEVLLVAVGRKPLTEALGLEGTKVEIERGFVKVDSRLRTGEPWVYAIGDLVSTPAYAHVASHEGMIAAEAIAGRQPEPINYDRVPNCTFSDPEVASIGLTEQAARQRGHKVRVGRFPLPPLGKAAILGAQEGFVKLVGDERYDELLGIHMIGPRVTEMIGEGSMALRLETTVEEMFHAIHAHPTLSEAIAEAALNLHARGIHL